MKMPISRIWKPKECPILDLRDIDHPERALAETRAAMESGANHITEVCDAA
jgi:hypothetical protein